MMSPDVARYFADIHQRGERRHTHTIAIKDGDDIVTSITVEVPAGLRTFDVELDGKVVIGLVVGRAQEVAA